MECDLYITGLEMYQYKQRVLDTIKIIMFITGDAEYFL